MTFWLALSAVAAIMTITSAIIGLYFTLRMRERTIGMSWFLFGAVTLLIAGGCLAAAVVS